MKFKPDDDTYKVREAIDCDRNGQPLLLAHTDAHATAITETCKIMGSLGIEVEQQS